MTDRTATPTTGLSRRAMLGAAAWSVPVITVATAAPAFAGSNDGWSVTSTSYEGTAAGVRNNAGTYQFQFAISVPVGATVKAPRGLLTFSTAAVNAAGFPDGTTVEDVSTARGFNPRDVNGVACLGLNPVTGIGTVNRFRSFQFNYAYDLPGPVRGTAPAVYPYTFEMTGVSPADAAGAMVVFSAANNTIHRAIAFRILAANNTRTYITEPA
jgi:hypothetical protein